jgi:hypothetical protein
MEDEADDAEEEDADSEYSDEDPYANEDAGSGKTAVDDVVGGEKSDDEHDESDESEDEASGTRAENRD